jgi:hypothetical protein
MGMVLVLPDFSLRSGSWKISNKILKKIYISFEGSFTRELDFALAA